jgi:hypothetical protein
VIIEECWLKGSADGEIFGEKINNKNKNKILNTE